MKRRGFIGSLLAALVAILVPRLPAVAAIAPIPQLDTAPLTRVLIGFVERKLSDGYWLVRYGREDGTTGFLRCLAWMDLTDLLTVGHEDCYPAKVAVYQQAGADCPLIVGVAVPVIDFPE